MTERLDTERGQDLMRQRRTSIEPLFGQIKHRLGPSRQFSRRGRDAVSDEWKLICATSNLLKLWRETTA
jgi:Transposase DDE domain